MKGFFNKILRIELKAKAFKEEAVPDSVYENYLGGKGLGTYLLMKENPPGVDPLSSGNRLIFTLGPITDSRIYGVLPAWRLYQISPDRNLFGILCRRKSSRTHEPDR
jgi:aldehyde:ferredoxin oxidoreductase